MSHVGSNDTNVLYFELFIFLDLRSIVFLALANVKF